MNNYDRIFSEITREAKRLAPDNVDPDVLVNLAMEIVNLEDQHRVKHTNIIQRIEDKIIMSTNQISIEES